MPALQGIRVLECATLLAGPYCAMLLGELGAEVTKVEPPGGEPGRRFGEEGAEDAFFAAVNRGKQGIQLDLRLSGDRDRFGALVAEADVLVENFLPSFREAVGIHDAWLEERNPGLVHCSVSGFGADGPYAGQPATDIVLQALSGLMLVSGTDGEPPVKVGLPVGDMVTGLVSALGVMAALREADRGEPQVRLVSTSILESLLAIQAPLISLFSALGRQPARLGTGNPFNAPVQMFATEDGHLAVSAFTDKFWRRLADAVGRPDLLDDERFATNGQRLRHRELLAGELAGRFLARDTESWVSDLRAAGVPCAPVNGYAEVLSDAHVRALGVLQQANVAGRDPLVTVGAPFSISGERPAANAPDLPALEPDQRRP